MYIYVLDFCQGGIYEIKCDNTNEDIEIEEIFKQYGLNIDNCSWMFSEVKLEIEQIEKI